MLLHPKSCPSFWQSLRMHSPATLLLLWVNFCKHRRKDIPSHMLGCGRYRFWSLLGLREFRPISSRMGCAGKREEDVHGTGDSLGRTGDLSRSECLGQWAVQGKK